MLFQFLAGELSMRFCEWGEC